MHLSSLLPIRFELWVVKLNNSWPVIGCCILKHTTALYMSLNKNIIFCDLYTFQQIYLKTWYIIKHIIIILNGGTILLWTCPIFRTSKGILVKYHCGFKSFLSSLNLNYTWFIKGNTINLSRIILLQTPVFIFVLHRDRIS